MEIMIKILSPKYCLIGVIPIEFKKSFLNLIKELLLRDEKKE